jgi:hypothetical protein
LFAQQITRLVTGRVSDHVRNSGRPANDATLLYATSLLGSAREEIDRADAKASILLAATGVVTGALLAGLIAGTWTPLKLPTAAQWLWWLGAAEAAMGICCLAWVVYPRGPKRGCNFPWAVSYYGDVLAFPVTSQLVTALHRSAETNIERVADQLRHISRIADRKYRLIRWGMRLLFLAVLTISATMLIKLKALRHFVERRRQGRWVALLQGREDNCVIGLDVVQGEALAVAVNQARQGPCGRARVGDDRGIAMGDLRPVARVRIEPLARSLKPGARAACQPGTDAGLLARRQPGGLRRHA